MLDLACGDGGLGEPLLARGLRYRGVDSTPEMVDAARRRLGAPRRVDVGDLNDYGPPEPVAATTVFRAIYYAEDRRAFFEHAAGYTQKKLVFDLNPRQYALDDVLGDLRAAGLRTVALRPFLVPQTASLPGTASPRSEGARGRPAARASRAALSLHVPRGRVALAAEERLEAGVEHRAQPAVVAVRRVDLLRDEGRRDAHLDTPRARPEAERDAVGLAVRARGSCRTPVTRAMAGCLSDPIPTGPMRTVAVAV